MYLKAVGPWGQWGPWGHGGSGVHREAVGCMVWLGVGCGMVLRGCGMVWHDRHGAEMVHHDPLCSMVLGECGQSHDPGTLS